MEADRSRLSSWCLVSKSLQARRLAGQGAQMASGQQFQRPRQSGDAVGVELDLQWLWVSACVAEHFTQMAQQPEPGGVGGGMELAGYCCSSASCSTSWCWLVCIWIRAVSRSSGRAAPAMAAANSTPVPSGRLSNNWSPAWARGCAWGSPAR